MNASTLGRLLTDSAGALLDSSRRFGLEELDGFASGVAGRLHAEGIRRGDRVGWQLPNGHEAIVAYLACWRVGAVAVPIHHRATVSEARRMTASADARVIAHDNDDVHHLAGHAPHPTLDAAPDDDAVVLFTAGSTGVAKGVRHRHGALTAKARAMVEVHGLTSDDVVLMPAPLAHISGLLNGVLVPAAAGMTSVLMDRWDPERALELIESERVSFMVGPPTFFLGLMDAPGFSPARVASLRLVSCGGAGVTSSFVDRASEELGAVVKRSYGSTEAPTVATSGPGDDPEHAGRHDGRAVGGVELRTSGDGELLVRGPELFVGYLDDGQTRAVMTDDGWFRTGDLAEIDAEGWLTITGRLTEVVIRGGENISTAEVESVLETHPLVRAAAAVGYPDDRLGERVAAFVVTSGPFDLDACRAWFAESGAATFKTPERVIVLDGLPVLPTGKVDKATLRDLAANPNPNPNPHPHPNEPGP